MKNEMNWKWNKANGNKRKRKLIQMGFWELGRSCGWLKAKKGGLWWLVVKLKKKKKEKRKGVKKWQKGERASAIVGEVIPPELWPAIWTAERHPFCLKIWGGVLLDKRNDSKVACHDFNGRILRFVVWL